jgi:hypothetical protein
MRELLANGKPIKRSQRRALRARGEKIWIGFAPETDRKTGKKIRGGRLRARP